MRLSAHDASFLYTENASGPMHGVGFTVLNGPTTYEDIFAFYASRIHLIPRLRQRAMFVPSNIAHPRWVDDPDFRLENHLVKHEVSPGTTLAQAFEIGLEISEPLLDRSRPLWLTYVIENVENQTLLVQLSHHAFVDGATAVAMFTVLTQPVPNAPPPEPPAPPWQPGRVPTSMELWQEAVTENFQKGAALGTQALTMGQELAQTMQQAAPLLARVGRPVMQAPWNASLVGPKRKYQRRERSLKQLRSIRKALGGTLNDVVVTVAMEGAARYMAALGEELEGQHLRLMCPVNVRGADDDPINGGGNRVSAMFPVLEAAPKPILERYAEVRGELQSIKDNNEAVLMDRLQQLQPFNPPVAMAPLTVVGGEFDPSVAAARAPLPIMPHQGQRPQQLGFNFTVTNVPGPTEKAYVVGDKVSATSGTLQLGGNLGFGFSTNSYAGTMFFNFTCDPRLVPDLKAMVACVEGALDELQAAAKGG